MADAAVDGGGPGACLLPHAAVENGSAKFLAIDHPGHAASAPAELPWEEVEDRDIIGGSPYWYLLQGGATEAQHVQVTCPKRQSL